MRTLAIDIETSPNLADVWGLWNQNVGINQLRESTRMLCFAAQWEGQKRTEFYSEWGDGPDMVRVARELLDEADVVVHYNGQRFDVPHLNRELILAGYDPPSPYKQVDLYREIKRAFSFPSYKLAYVAPALGVGEKVSTGGHELWIKVLAGDRSARKLMREYNCQDTALLIPLYHKVRAWVSTPATYGSMSGKDVCPACGSDNLHREGHAYTLTGRYQRYVCNNCGKWSRATRRDMSTGITSVGRS